MQRFHRSAHVTAALAVALCAAGTVAVWPDLTKDVPTAFATVTGYATVYGVIFTVIEVLYARSAAELAAAEARKAAHHAAAMFDLGTLSECMSCIENVLDQLHNDRPASSMLLSRVVKMYSAQFAAQVGDTASPSRGNLEAVEAYIVSLRHSRNAGESARLRKALFSMTSQLSAASAQIKGKVV